MVAFRSSSKKPSIQNFSPSTHAAALTPSSTHAAKLIQQHFHCSIHVSVFTTNSTHASALILHSSECASVLISPQFRFTSSLWGKNQLCRDKKKIGFRWRAGKAWIGPAVGWAGLGGKKVLYILCFFVVCSPPIGTPAVTHAAINHSGLSWNQDEWPAAGPLCWWRWVNRYWWVWIVVIARISPIWIADLGTSFSFSRPSCYGTAKMSCSSICCRNNVQRSCSVAFSSQLGVPRECIASINLMHWNKSSGKYLVVTT